MEEGHVYDMEVDTFAPYYNLLWSTRELSMDWVTPDFMLSDDWQYPPVAGEKNWVGSVMLRPTGLDGTIVSFPLYNLLRFTSATYATPQGFFPNGTKVPDGDYKILLRTLRTFGDRHNPNDWETAITPWFRVAGKNVSTTTSSTVVPTSSSTSTSSTVSATHTCDATPLNIVAHVRGETRNLTLSQNFLAVDIPGATVVQYLDFAMTGEGFLRTSINGYTTNRFAAALTTTQNNLIYIFQPSLITGNWKHLICNITANGTLDCTVNGSDKSILQICSGEFIRIASEVVSGCDVVQLDATPNPDPFCNSASSSPTFTISTAQVTTTSSSSVRATTTRCNANNCARAVTGTLANGSLRYPAARTDCSSYLAVTEFITSGITVLPKRTAAPVIEERQIEKPIPTYASACTSPNAYSSICNCWGVVAETTTITVAPPM